MYECKFCNKECKNDNSLRNHERLCKSNLNRQTTPFHDNHFQKTKTKSNQFIKSREEGKEYKFSDHTLKKMRKSALASWDEERRKSWSEHMKIQASKNVENHPESYSYKNFCGRSKKTLYRNEWMHSNWELEFAKWLDSKQIEWTKKVKYFEYVWEGKTRKYFPDFYLSEFDIYVEVKGYETDRDLAKWNSVHNLLVLRHKEIKQIIQNTFSIGLVSQEEENVPHKDESAISSIAQTTNFGE